MSNAKRHGSSIFTGLLLIVIGLLFLVQRFHPNLGIGHVLRTYWPILLILWGGAKLIDYFAARGRSQDHPPLLTASEAAVLIFLVVVLITMATLQWTRANLPRVSVEIEDNLLPSQSLKTQQLPPRAIPAGSHVSFSTLRGDIKVHAGEGNELRVSADITASGKTDEEAEVRLKDVEVVIDQTGDGYSIHPNHPEDTQTRIRVDLDVELPKDSIVATATSRGDTSITGLAGDVAVQSAHGDVDVHNCAANVAVDLEDGDAHITDVGGNVSARGHGSDLEVGNVRGNAAVDGRFKGTALLRSIGGTAIFATGPTGITIDRLAGQMEIDSDSIALSDAAGSVKIATKNKDIDAENVEGALQIANVHADIKVRLAKPPSQAITISNQSGGVDLTLPSKSSFTILATSTSGEVQSDFDAPALSLQNSSGSGKLSGTIGSGGPQLRITTSYGTISLLKSF